MVAKLRVERFRKRGIPSPQIGGKARTGQEHLGQIWRPPPPPLTTLLHSSDDKFNRDCTFSLAAFEFSEIAAINRPRGLN